MHACFFIHIVIVPIGRVDNIFTSKRVFISCHCLCNKDSIMKVKQYEESAFAGNKPLKIPSIVEYDSV